MNRNCDDRPCSLLHKPSRIRESCLSQPAAWTTKTKREQNRIRSGTSEAEVTNNIEDCARLIVLLQLTTDRHEAFRVAPALAGGGAWTPVGNSASQPGSIKLYCKKRRRRWYVHITSCRSSTNKSYKSYKTQQEQVTNKETNLNKIRFCRA